MDPVTMQCGQCGQVMAISREHLGSQVYCPHCQAIVQTQAPAPKPEPAIGGWLEKPESESIFSPPEVHDDLFGAPPQPKIEIPAAAPPADPLDRPLGQVPAWASQPEPPAATSPAPQVAEAPWHESDPPAASAPAPVELGEDEEPLTLARGHKKKKSVLVPTLLIFLIPYCLIATGVIVYLLFFYQRSSVHPLEYLPDPKPKEGARRVQQVQHDVPLPDHLKTRLEQPLRVGDLEVTPLRVRLTKAGDLVLHLKMKNLSRDTVFNPISDEFLKATDTNLVKGGGIYTYLDAGRRLYGGFADWRGAKDAEDFTGDIGPGEEETIRITTLPKYRGDSRQIARSGEALLWRVQVRRGFASHRGNDISATAVIGVSFTPREISKEG